jgi:hypothetical protein
MGTAVGRRLLVRRMTEWLKDCIYRKLLGLPYRCPHCDKDLPKEVEIVSNRQK